MRRNAHWLASALFVCFVFVMTARPARAQGYSTSEWTDYGTDIDAELDAYFDEGGVSCVSSSWSSTLNGQTVYVGDSDYVIQTINPATPTVQYVWTISYNITVSEGPWGGCYDVQGSFSNTVAIHTTYYSNPSLIGDWCTYNAVSCAAGTPYCTNLTRCAGINSPLGGTCAPYMEAFWVTYEGTCEFCLGESSDYNGYCD
jgi:hypothetical protein